MANFEPIHFRAVDLFQIEDIFISPGHDYWGKKGQVAFNMEPSESVK